MELFDILGAGCIACGPETIEALQRRFGRALTTARAAGIIAEGDDLDVLARHAQTHPEQSSVWSDLHRLPARYSAIAFLQWTARDLQRAMQRGPDWYEAAARGHMNATYAEAILYSHNRDAAALAFDRWKHSRAGAAKRRTTPARRQQRDNLIASLAEQYRGRCSKEKAAELISQAPGVGFAPERVQRELTRLYPGKAWPRVPRQR